MKTPFYSLVVKAHHAQSAQIRPYMHDIGLSLGQPKVLNYLVGHPQATQKDIANACDIEAATVSKLLDNMEEKGLITRNRIEGNRRSFCILITDLGRAKQKQWIAHCLEVEEVELAGFSEEEKAMFRDYLSRMYTNLTKRELE